MCLSHGSDTGVRGYFFEYYEAIDDDTIVLRRPSSFAKRRCCKAAFANVVAQTLSEISAVLGVTAAELIRTAEEESGVSAAGFIR